VILAQALSNLYATSPVFNQAAHAEQIWEDIQSVVNMRLLKINLYFEDAWWEDGSKVQPPVQYGPSFTDLPVNAIYPFYSLKGPEDQGHPAALTIYCDFNSTNFWQGLQNVTPMFDSPLQQQNSKPPQVIFPASVAVVKEAMNQIQQVYHVAEVPEPVMTSYRLWGGEEDFGYGYHQWALNANDREVMERLTEPVPGIHTCNEAFSDDQGWVNGSLRSANLVLRRFGIEDLPDMVACCEPSQS